MPQFTYAMDSTLNRDGLKMNGSYIKTKYYRFRLFSSSPRRFRLDHTLEENSWDVHTRYGLSTQQRHLYRTSARHDMDIRTTKNNDGYWRCALTVSRCRGSVAETVCNALICYIRIRRLESGLTDTHLCLYQTLLNCSGYIDAGR